jgi:hypothetical protein
MNKCRPLVKCFRWRKSWAKTCFSVTLSTTNSIWTGLELNPSLQFGGLILENITLAKDVCKAIIQLKYICGHLLLLLLIDKKCKKIHAGIKLHFQNEKQWKNMGCIVDFKNKAVFSENISSIRWWQGAQYLSFYLSFPMLHYIYVQLNYLSSYWSYLLLFHFPGCNTVKCRPRCS